MATEQQMERVNQLFRIDVDSAIFKLIRYVKDKYQGVDFCVDDIYSENSLSVDIFLTFKQNAFAEHKTSFMKFIGEKYYYAGGIEYMYHPELIHDDSNTIKYKFNIRKNESSYLNITKLFTNREKYDKL
jgi:hypothetical protein